MDFPYDDNEAPRFDSVWNPKYGNLLMTHSVVEVLDVASQSVIATFNEPAAWSGDGKSVVAVKDHHIVFTPISADRR